MTEDDDLRLLLHSPALTLDPPQSLVEDVRRGARRRRLRTRVGGAALATVVVAGGLALGPAVADSVSGLRSRGGQTTGLTRDPRAPAATSEVVTLQQINGAQVLTWFEGSTWCTATTRITREKSCSGPINPEHQGFSRVLASGSPSVTVDAEHVVAGLLPPGASRVVVHMKDGREYEAKVIDGGRFLQPVWSARVDDRDFPVEYYLAYDTGGHEVSRKPAR